MPHVSMRIRLRQARKVSGLVRVFVFQNLARFNVRVLIRKALYIDRQIHNLIDRISVFGSSLCQNYLRNCHIHQLYSLLT